jgi:RND superfamily putative drug exporter
MITGARSRRNLLAATLGGRVDPVAGRLQVEGHPLPSDGSRVRRLVAMADVAQPVPDITVGRLLDEHIRLTRARRGSARLVHHWVQNIDSALAGIGAGGRRVAASTPLVALTPLETATVLVAAAMAEGTPVVSITQPDDFAPADRLYVAATLMAPPQVTIVVGATGHPPDVPSAGRPVITIDVDAVDRREVLQ